MIGNKIARTLANIMRPSTVGHADFPAVVAADGTPAVSLQWFALTLTPAAAATVTSTEQTFTVPTNIVLPAGCIIAMTKPTAQVGIGAFTARRASATTVGITWPNPTAGGVTPTAAEVYNFLVFSGVQL